MDKNNSSGSTSLQAAKPTYLLWSLLPWHLSNVFTAPSRFPRSNEKEERRH